MTFRAEPSSGAASPATPSFLTVEEAARVLRIGRTAAYLLAKRWEATGGAEGMPVVRFGRPLRVPASELERLAGGPIRPVAPMSPVEHASVAEPVPNRTAAPRRSTRRESVEPQPTLFPEGP
ncbi:MAG TPA: helix-turn-helix domain-containing protein [Microthrixaceae bacterium]|nr:helix-turn-helix domain-containing protein [Microthrixaceae bacterium]HMT26417.1 helix-turn-helix domain-containing protein [Microthrixaceae bacterium]HMT62370.1 helix-turn-helix domain-containing protein [Microthrixaceae bacterium]